MPPLHSRGRHATRNTTVARIGGSKLAQLQYADAAMGGFVRRLLKRPQNAYSADHGLRAAPAAVHLRRVRQLRREGVIVRNPVADSVMPTLVKTTIKERAVLSDDDLTIYLSWANPKQTWSTASLERQVMACMSRLFGGLRTGDLHALSWEAFDVEDGRFEWEAAAIASARSA